MKKVWYDTETCGFVGMPVLLQSQVEGSDEIELYELWREPIRKSLDLIEWMMQQNLIGFNLTFDHFQLCKFYTVLDAFTKANKHLDNRRPVDFIQDIARFERAGMDGPCLKPASACDLMLLARKNKWQITMERSDIRVKRVPTQIAWDLAKVLEERIIFDPILFARSQAKRAKWVVKDIELKNGRVDQNFKDLVLTFKASGGLKALAVAACDFLPKDVISYQDVAVPKQFLPDEVEYAPFADAIKHRYAPRKYKNRRKTPLTWVDLIEFHIDHWAFNPGARQYAKNDVVFTRALWKAFGEPEGNDIDSRLACAVAAVRWRGYSVDLPGLEDLIRETQAKKKAAPTSPAKVKEYISELLSDEEKAILDITKTGKLVLEGIVADPLFADHPVRARAAAVMAARFADDELKLYKKLVLAQRLHFSVKVIGALSSRMSGDNKLNPQGVKRDKNIRRKFTYAHGGLLFLGGDFDSFEVGIADSKYKDARLHAELMAGKKIHTLFAKMLFPEATEEEIIASKGSSVLDMYDYGKRGVFSQIYGGNWSTLVKRLRVSDILAKAAEARWLKNYPGIAQARADIERRFCSMKQPGGIGSRIIWSDAADYVESMIGHKRFFTLENRICKELYELANKPLARWKDIEGKVVRRDRTQTIGGAVMSALFACAFAIQSSVARQAGNHEIQSTGAEITKDVQGAIWDVQPIGIHPWLVQPCNIHDELLCPTHPDVVDRVKTIVADRIKHHSQLVPMIAMDFKRMETWADK